MTLEEKLASKGERIDFHVHVYAPTLAVIDKIASTYDCSRSAVVEAWASEYSGLSLEGKVEKQKGGRRVKPAAVKA